MLPILLDTDPGVDDALALLLALRSPELELVAVTTVAGNVGLEATTRNALLLLELAGRPDVAVHMGETPPPGRSSVMAADVHGDDGLGGILSLKDPEGRCRYLLPRHRPHSTPAVEAILGYARARPDEITLVAIGPLTNVARAAERDPDGLRRFREIVHMGGTFRCPGNITPVAEFNVFVDPDAVQTVLDTGVPLRFVPLDVTEQVMLQPADLNDSGERKVTSSEEQLTLSIPTHRDHPFGAVPPLITRQFFADLLAHTFDCYTERLGYPGCHLHDPLAIAAVIRPELFRFREAFVEIETEGVVTRGMTVADLRNRREAPAPNCAFAEEVAVEEVKAFVLGRLLG